ncbi:MAG TPA: DUF6452 family protein [Cyclobacteriaceae bacterium]|nr:DUF6452 family protein [Cyclobacteriaceae bacterium]
MKYVFAFFVGGLILGCFSEGDCLITATNQLHIRLKKRSNLAKDTAVSFDYIQFSSVEHSSVASGNVTTQEFLVPLDTKSDSTLIVFKRTGSATEDFLLLSYLRQTKVISKDCGAYTYYVNLKVLSTNLDSTQIRVFNTVLLKDPTSTALAAYALNYQILY